MQTDLCGIKWRVYTWESGGGGGAGGVNPGNEDDPVLASYARCLSADVLCVWRRACRRPHSSDSLLQDSISSHHHHHQHHHHHHQQRPVTLRQAPKELWVFWYGDEPDLSNLVSQELTKGGQSGHVLITTFTVHCNLMRLVSNQLPGY